MDDNQFYFTGIIASIQSCSIQNGVPALDFVVMQTPKFERQDMMCRLTGKWATNAGTCSDFKVGARIHGCGGIIWKNRDKPMVMLRTIGFSGKILSDGGKPEKRGVSERVINERVVFND